MLTRHPVRFYTIFKKLMFFGLGSTLYFSHYDVKKVVPAQYEKLFHLILAV